MAFRLSTGLVNSMLTNESLKEALEGAGGTPGFAIDIYTGARPASADLPPSGTKLVSIFSDGVSAGLHFENTASAGKIVKKASENWSGTCANTGVGGWFRVRKLADDNSNSTTFARMDGTIATSGAEMNLNNLNFAQNAVFTLSSAEFTFLQG